MNEQTRVDLADDVETSQEEDEQDDGLDIEQIGIHLALTNCIQKCQVTQAASQMG
jgi:hypothetical protein